MMLCATTEGSACAQHGHESSSQLLPSSFWTFSAVIMHSIIDKDAQISEVEMRIVRVGQELVRLEVERNELAPLLRLPNELHARITYITQRFLDRRVALRTLVSIYHRLRSLCLDTPSCGRLSVRGGTCASCSAS